MREDVPLIGAQPSAPPAEDQPAPSSALDKELNVARALLAQKMMEGLQMDPTPALNQNLCFGLSHDGFVIDAIMDALIAKGALTKEEVEQGLLGKLKERILAIEQHNAALRHRIVIAKPGKG